MAWETNGEIIPSTWARKVTMCRSETLTVSQSVQPCASSSSRFSRLLLCIGDGDDDLIASLHAENSVQVFFATTPCDFEEINGTKIEIQKQECCHSGTQWNGTACAYCPEGMYGIGSGLSAQCVACPTDSCTIEGLNHVPATCSAVTNCPRTEEELQQCSCPVDTARSVETDACVPCAEGQIRPDTPFQRDITSLGNYTEWELQQGTCFVEKVKADPLESTWVLVGLVACGILILCAVTTSVWFWRKTRREQNMWKIDASELQYDAPPRLLGEGAFGAVYLAQYRGTSVAVKKLHGRKATVKKNAIHMSSGGAKHTRKPTHISTAQRTKQPQEEASTPQNLTLLRTKTSGSTNNTKGYALKDFATDMRILSSLRHPCICTIMGAVVGPRSEPQLVMEYIEYKSLSDLLKKSTVQLDGNTVLGILRDISQGLQFLHNTKPQVIHGDIKSHNVLVDSKFSAKLTDFGISYKYGIKGTPYWMAPEILRNESECTAASDVYSFGILLCELYGRKDPYEGEEGDYHTILGEICDPEIHRRPAVPQSMPSRVAVLMHDCLVADPSERPTMDECASRRK